MSKTCGTCCFWDTPTPEAAYRADCAIGQMTRPEAWQTCRRWSPRAVSGGALPAQPAPSPTVAQQSQARGLANDLWNIPSLVSETLLGYQDGPPVAAVVRREWSVGPPTYARYWTTATGRYEEASTEPPEVDQIVLPFEPKG